MTKGPFAGTRVVVYGVGAMAAIVTGRQTLDA